MLDSLCYSNCTISVILVQFTVCTRHCSVCLYFLFSYFTDPFNVFYSFIGTSSSVLDPDPFNVCHSFIGSSVLDTDPSDLSQSFIVNSVLDPDPFNVCHSFIGSSVLVPDPFNVCHSFIGSSMLDPDHSAGPVILSSAGVYSI